jgi:hypothetical protein
MPQSASKALSLNVAAVAPLAVSSGALPDAVEFQPYSQQLQASGGTAPFNWSISAGALLAGITLSAQGLLAGTPTVGGAFNFTVQVTDSGA